jgi:hypothetical protein
MADRAYNSVDGGQVVRDHSWVEREYGREKWPAILSEIGKLRASGETSLARAVAILKRIEWLQPDRSPTTVVCRGKHLELPSSLAWSGCFGMIVESLLAACREGTGAILDLGSGWGRSLFDLWLQGGPCNTPYFACEFTSTGRECAAALAKLEPRLDLRTAPFDFNEPDFSFLPHPLHHAVLFTISSAQQLPFTDIERYRSLLTVAEQVDCLHFEQIGWQMEPRASSEQDQDYAIRNDYNRNLWHVLTELRDSGEIEFVSVERDLIGLTPFYPLSFIHWRCRARS